MTTSVERLTERTAIGEGIELWNRQHPEANDHSAGSSSTYASHTASGSSHAMAEMIRQAS